jgi:hypothetical protein
MPSFLFRPFSVFSAASSRKIGLGSRKVEKILAEKALQIHDVTNSHTKTIFVYHHPKIKREPISFFISAFFILLQWRKRPWYLPTHTVLYPQGGKNPD